LFRNWVRAEPAALLADFVAVLLRRIFDAIFPTRGDVCSFRAMLNLRVVHDQPSSLRIVRKPQGCSLERYTPRMWIRRVKHRYRLLAVFGVPLFAAYLFLTAPRHRLNENEHFLIKLAAVAWLVWLCLPFEDQKPKKPDAQRD
jgi:hypothetical protein